MRTDLAGMKFHIDVVRDPEAFVKVNLDRARFRAYSTESRTMIGVDVCIEGMTEPWSELYQRAQWHFRNRGIEFPDGLPLMDSGFEVDTASLGVPHATRSKKKPKKR